jgi:hypothetical protein
VGGWERGRVRTSIEAESIFEVWVVAGFKVELPGTRDKLAGAVVWFLFLVR